MKNVLASPATRRASHAARSAPPALAVKTLVAATAAALLLIPGVRSARAQVIGDIDVRSRLGERFFAAVPVQSASALDPNCVRVGRSPAAPEGADALRGTSVRVNPTGAVESIIIETAGAVTSPIVGLRLEVGCTNPVVRDYVVLGDVAAPPVASVAPQAAPQAPAAAAQPQAQRPRTAARAPAAGAAAPAPRVAAAAPPAASVPRASTPDAAAGGSVPAVVPRATARTGAESLAAPAAGAPPTPAPAAVAPAPGRPAAVADTDAQKRIAELRARSDDHAANLLALEDRLSLLQKQAELLKAQLEQVLAAQAAGAAASASAATAPVSAPAAQAAPVPGQAMQAAPARTPRTMADVLTDWRVLGGALGALLFGAVAYRLGRRKPVRPVPAATAEKPAWQRPLAATGVAASEPALDHVRTQEFRAQAPLAAAQQTAEWERGAQPIQADETVQWSAPPTTSTMAVPEGSAASAAATTNPSVGITRDFHITQQFQPSNERTVAISTPEEIVQQARTHYMDDGDTFRAIDLLEMAVSVRTDSPRPWQALFAIYRRENMPERFQRLALAYRQAFGEDANWPAIQGLGYALDANNPLYEAARDAEPIPEDLLERWLGVPLDFTAHLLANEMHDQLMETFPGRAKKRKRVAGE